MGTVILIAAIVWLVIVSLKAGYELGKREADRNNNTMSAQ